MLQQSGSSTPAARRPRGTGAGARRAAKREASQRLTTFVENLASSLFSSPEEPARHEPSAIEKVLATPKYQPYNPYAPGISGGSPRLQTDAERDVSAEAARQKEREDRMAALQMSTGALSTTPDMLLEGAKELSQEEYLRLSDRQRAAVDFNTMLADAVRKDRRRQDEYENVDPVQREKYESQVDSMFGEDRGSDLYAPETLAVLKQLQLGKDEEADLDDFLNLSVAVTDDDLKYFEKPDASIMQPTQNLIQSWVQGDDQSHLPRVNYQEGLVSRTEQLQQKLAEGKRMLQNFNVSAAVDRQEYLTSLGGRSNPSIGLGFGGTQTDQDFQGLFEAISRQENVQSIGQILDQARAAVGPEMMSAFGQYADARLTNADLYGGKLGEADGVKYARAPKIRKQLNAWFGEGQ